MNRYYNIVLIGPMGSGKTTVGKELANKCKKNYYDSDHEIFNFTGLNISNIFNSVGEIGFRKIEEKIILKLTLMNNIIISTGGGTITSKNNINVLFIKGKIIYLKVSILKQLYRIKYDSYRPILNYIIINKLKLNKNQVLNFLYKERTHIYNIADYIISNEINTLKHITKYILILLNKSF